MHVFDRSDEPGRPAATGFADRLSVMSGGSTRARDERRRQPVPVPDPAVPLEPLIALVGAAELTVADVLRHLGDQAADELVAADAVLMTVNRRSGGREVVATAELALATDELQRGLREGPVLDAVAAGQPVGSDDLSVDRRWPRLAGALGTLEVRSALCLPVELDGGDAATLSLYAQDIAAFDERTHQVAGRLAARAATAVGDALVLERTRRLMVELHLQGVDRRVVEDAVTVLMEENGVGAEEALAVLQMLGRTEDEDVATVARAVVAARTGDLSTGTERAPRS